MAEKFTGWGDWTTGTDKSGLNLFNAVATPTDRGKIYDILVGCAGTPADQAGKFSLGRTTAVGTEGSGFTPNNLDPGGPAGAFDFGVAHSAEPTYTSNKELLVFALNQRMSYRWVAREGSEILTAATQNNGAGLKTKSHTGTPTATATILFEE